jgi:hypothetical protein
MSWIATSFSSGGCSLKFPQDHGLSELDLDPHRIAEQIRIENEKLIKKLALLRDRAYACVRGDGLKKKSGDQGNFERKCRSLTSTVECFQSLFAEVFPNKSKRHGHH